MGTYDYEITIGPYLFFVKVKNLHRCPEKRSWEFDYIQIRRAYFSEKELKTEIPKDIRERLEQYIHDELNEHC